MPVPADSLAPGPQTITKAAQVQNALDDTPCTLEGNILERLSKNKYVFRMIPER